jgi:polyisoprenoid-binding protein YceI
MMSRVANLFAVVSLAAATVVHAAGSKTTYTADAAVSRLEFAGQQAGAEFKGVLHRFTAVVEFAPDALSSSHLDVQINLDSLDTQDKDRDQTMRGGDFFDISRFPLAHYVTRSVTKTNTGYSAVGALTLHGVTKDVPINFQFIVTPSATKLEGTARVNRLDFGVGQGEWRSTEWVSDEVRVAFSLLLEPKP